MNIVFVKHDPAGKEYAFSVPAEMAKHVYKGDTVVVETMRGISTGIATTGVITGEGALDKAVNDGAYVPLKPVIGKLYPELRAIIKRDLQIMFAEYFGVAQNGSDELPF